MKKVFHIRIDSPPGYNSNAIEAAWIKNGYDYIGFNWQEYRFNHGLIQMRKEILRIISEYKPDLVFAHVQNPEAIDLDTWKEMADKSFVINYTFDVRDELRMLWMYEVANYIGFTFFASYNDVSNCLILGLQNVGHLHSSCDMDLYCKREGNLYAFDIVFCGNKYENTNLEFPMAAERQRMIEFLEKRYGKSSFMVYGQGQRGGLIPPETEKNVYNFSRIAISQNNYSLDGYTSDRIWRIMASGTMCLSKYYSGIDQDFKKEVHLDWWKDFDELKDLVDYYLKNEKERKSVADAGHDFVRANHKWENRISEILETIPV